MRLLLTLLLILGQLDKVAFGAAPQTSRPRVEELIVSRLDLVMPKQEPDDTNHPSKTEEFLWAKFMNKDAAPFFPEITNNAWRKELAAFERALLEKAKEMKLPHTALKSALNAVKESGFNEKLAVLPVAAYLIKCEGKDAWAILYNWEDDFDENAVLDMPPPQLSKKEPQTRPQPEKPSPLSLEHRRVFVFSVGTGDLVGYTTCM